MRRAYRTDNRDDAYSEPDAKSDENQPAASEWTKRELLAVCQLSAKTFDMFRKAARVKGPSHGGLSHVFSAADVIAIIVKCEGGSFTERGGPPAQAWRKLLADAGVRVPEQIKLRGRRLE